MTVDVPTSVNFFWTGATLTSGLGVYPWSFDEDDSRHGLFCSNYTYPGSDGTFSEGITGVHEVGHYFGLYHTFENGCSNPGDEVDDTPYQSQPNYGCPSNNYSCGSYDDIGNFMDYMDDDCLDHFTDGQVDRIEWALETYRPTLIEGTGYEGPVWYVSATGSDSTGDGSEENPFATIQFGLASADEGDTVLVGDGMYVENIIWPATNGIKLIGSGEENCVIDGDSTGRVITFHDSSNVNIDTTTLITGFTIQNGFSDFENTGEKPGGGIYCSNASPMLTECTLKENYAYGDGGGIALLDSSDMIIANVKFQDNMARGWRTPGQWPRYRGKGGGIFIVNSDPVLTNVEITDNYAGKYGGGVYLLYSSASFTHFTISGNIGSGILQKGGGVFCESTPNATFTEGIIVDNVGPYLGGGIAVSPAMYDSSSFHVELTNVLIQNNTSRQWGGGIYGSNISLSGCTIKENTATYNGGGIYNEDFFSDGEISFSPTNRCNIYSNTVEDSSEVGNDIAISVDYYGIPQSFMDVILDTFTVLTPTDYYATPIDSFSFDILVGLDELSSQDELIPSEFALHPPYPNPFNPITTLRYVLPENALVNITIYDMMGRVVKSLINSQQTAGYRSTQWNATNDAGSPVSAGIYLYTIQAGDFRQTRKMVLLK
ncbi:MAG TPA: T9SS type A sorting domain-containing protein [Candidatus Marinimicrobia bacterium]|nr:T9SS type A sorting domain-containing protein [Candidatus Neomarinimicrobiota bacterium]